MKRLRAIGFWAHLVAGTTAGLIILVLSLTGAALGFKPQILRAIDTWHFEVAANGRVALDASALVAALHEARPGESLRTLTLPRDPATAAAAQIGTSTVYLDPYTGVVLGESSVAAQQLFRTVEDWHRWLAMSGDGRQTGRRVIGIANVALLFLALSGLYLWWPRQWTLTHLRPIVLFRRTSTGRARDFNWHNVAGFWAAPMLVVMTATGAVMSYPSLNSLLQRMTGDRAVDADREGRGPGAAGDVRGGGRPGPARGAEQTAVAVDDSVLDAALGVATTKEPDWSVLTLQMPRTPGAPLAVSVATGTSATPASRSVLTVDSATGTVRGWQVPGVATLAQRVRTWIRFAHTGEQWGVAGQAFATLGCLAAVLLVWSGLSLSLRRFANAVRRPRVARAVRQPIEA